MRHDNDWRFLLTLAAVFIMFGATMAIGLFLFARWTP